jgi:hypothetical protein
MTPAITIKREAARARIYWAAGLKDHLETVNLLQNNQLQVESSTVVKLVTPHSLRGIKKMDARSKLILTSKLSLSIFCTVLLITPGLIFLLANFFRSKSTSNLPHNTLITGALFEMTGLGLLALVTGLVVYLAITLSTKQKLILMDGFSLVSSQAISSFLLVTALIHNPQNEFCKPSVDGSAIAKIYQLETCSLTTDFWMQGGITGFALAILFVVALRIARVLFFRIFPN